MFEQLYLYIEKLDHFVWGVVWLLIFLSLIPKLRKYTGSGIILGTYIGGALFWLISLGVTYSFFGFWGIFIGIILFGLGVFFTAILGLLLNGQVAAALYFGFILVQIYLIRLLGIWIEKKYEAKQYNLKADKE